MATKQRRFDMRLDAQQKRLLERAAAIKGVRLTEFVRSNLLDRAREVVEREETTVLSDRDRETFLRILDAGAGPNEALKRAWKRSRARRA